MKDFKLDQHPKIGTGLKAPDNYFDNLSSTITARIHEGEMSETKVISLFKRKVMWIPAAAAVLILALMIPFYNSVNTTTNTLDSTTIENYINYGSDISQYELVNLLDDEDIESIDKNIKLDDTMIEEILTTNSNFESYITE